MKCQEPLTRVFQMVFANPNLCVRPEMTPNDIDGWDSMAHLNLIAAIEARFHIKFATKELRSIKTVSDLGALIDGKIA
jgi:acyl carrier protein